jgi:hypothetical protein
MLVGLIDRTDGIVEERRPRLFNVTTENMSDRLALGEANQPFVALRKG